MYANAPSTGLPSASVTSTSITKLSPSLSPGSTASSVAMVGTHRVHQHGHGLDGPCHNGIPMTSPLPDFTALRIALDDHVATVSLAATGKATRAGCRMHNQG